MMGVLKISFILLLVGWSVQGDAEGIASTTGGQEPETRVVGGKDATKGLVPHQVALKQKYGWIFCGAAIISDRWMLTAAYCVERLKPTDFIALVGTSSRIRGGTIYEINKVISHKAYNKPYRFNNDIAVISTKKTIEFNENVQPLPLPKKNIQTGLSCIVSGWGYLNNQWYSPDKLRYLHVETLTSDQCSKILSNGRSSTVILPLNMCTLSKRGEGTCLSDAGSSLVCNGTSAGIVNYNFPCAVGRPDLYSNTYMYKNWIKQNTKSP